MRVSRIVRKALAFVVIANSCLIGVAAAQDPVVQEIDIGLVRYANGSPDGFFALVYAKPGIKIRGATLTLPGGGGSIPLSMTKPDSSLWSFYTAPASSAGFPDGLYSMSVITSGGNTTRSATLGGAIPPSAPTNVHAVGIGTSEVTIAWDAYSSPGSIQQLTAFAASTNGPALGVKSSLAATSGDSENKTAVTSATSLLITGLVPGKPCIGGVTAVGLGAGSSDGVMFASKAFAGLPASFTTLALPGQSPWGMLFAALVLLAILMIFARSSWRTRTA